MNRPRTTFSFSSTSRILASYYRYKLSALNLINFHKIEFETNQGRRAARHPTPSWEEVYNYIPICNTFLMSFKTRICLWEVSELLPRVPSLYGSPSSAPAGERYVVHRGLLLKHARLSFLGPLAIDVNLDLFRPT